MITLAIEHIVCDPGKRGGKPYIAGTGMTVQYIAALHNCGWTIQDLTGIYPTNTVFVLCCPILL